MNTIKTIYDLSKKNLKHACTFMIFLFSTTFSKIHFIYTILFLLFFSILFLGYFLLFSKEPFNTIAILTLILSSLTFFINLKNYLNSNTPILTFTPQKPYFILRESSRVDFFCLFIDSYDTLMGEEKINQAFEEMEKGFSNGILAKRIVELSCINIGKETAYDINITYDCDYKEIIKQLSNYTGLRISKKFDSFCVTGGNTAHSFSFFERYKCSFLPSFKDKNCRINIIIPFRFLLLLFHITKNTSLNNAANIFTNDAPILTCVLNLKYKDIYGITRIKNCYVDFHLNYLTNPQANRPFEAGFYIAIDKTKYHPNSFSPISLVCEKPD